MLKPKQTKFRAFRKGRIKGFVNPNLSFGEFGLKATSKGRLSSRQIEAGRRVLRRAPKRTGFVWVRAFPSIPVTSKPSEVRIGKGKGTVSFWAARVKEGQILYEVSGVSENLAKTALKKVSYKLPVSSVFISRAKPLY